MKRPLSIATVALASCFTAVIVTTLSSIGCMTHSDSGKIYIDRPEVFTRERLINRRLGEQAWLEKQLESDAEFTLQGSRDVREFTGFALALKGEFDPLGGAQAESLISDVKSNSRIGQLQDELQLEVLRKQLDMVRATTDPIQLVPGQITATNPPTLPANITNPLPAASATINLTTFATNAIPSTPPSGSGVKSSAKLSSVQSLDDKLAFRNAIQARLREQELDDTHDLEGMTLYTLKFDIAVEPGKNNPSLGEVRISVPTNSFNTVDLTTNDFKNWLDSLNRELRDESIGLQRRHYMKLLTDEESAQLMAFALTQVGESAPQTQVTAAAIRKEPTNAFSPSKTLFQQLETDATTVIDSTDATPADISTAWRSRSLYYDFIQRANAARGLAFIIQTRYQEALDGIAVLPPPTNWAPLDGMEFYIVTARPATNGYQNFLSLVNKLPGSRSPYVYTVEPKEYAQNISDVSARERLVSYSLALSAVIPQAGSKVAANMDYIRRSQELLEAIKRRPLVVGYADGETTFGWIVGPRFEVEDARVKFTQAHVQHSVQATVVVPAWWSKLCLEPSYSWLKEDGNSYKVNSGKAMQVTLPRDYSAITRAFLALNDKYFAKPSIMPRWNSDTSKGSYQITVSEGSDDSILIRGRDLWRNPEVYLAGQPATSVRVLPDMGGLWAKFESIRLPASENRQAQLADLTVVTSGGSVVLRDGVRILPSGDPLLQSVRFATLKNNFITLSSNLVFATDIRMLPKSYGDLVIKVSDANQEHSRSTSLAADSSPQTPVWSVPFVAKFMDKFPSATAQQIWIDLGIRSRPDATQPLTSVLAGKPHPIVFFPTESESQFVLRTPNFTVPPVGGSGTIQLALATSANLFTNAWPGVTHELANGRAKLIFKKGSNDIAEIAIPATVTDFATPLDVRVGRELDGNLNASSATKFSMRVIVGDLTIPVAQEISVQ